MQIYAQGMPSARRALGGAAPAGRSQLLTRFDCDGTWDPEQQSAHSQGIDFIYQLARAGRGEVSEPAVSAT